MGGDDQIGPDEAFRVGAWLVRPHELTLERDNESVPLEAKVMDVLVELARSQGRVVTREALIEAVWGTEFGGDESLTRAISLIRRALGDTRGEHNHIRTVPKRGYQLIADVLPANPDTPPRTTRPPHTSDTPDSPPPVASNKTGSPRDYRNWRLAILIALAAVIVIGVGLNALLTSSDTAEAAPEIQAGTIEIRAFESPPGDLRAQRFEQILSGSLAAVSIRSFRKTVASNRLAEFAVNGVIDETDEQGTLTLQLSHTTTGTVLLTSSTTAPLAEFENAGQIALSNLGSVLQCVLNNRHEDDDDALILLVNVCESFSRWDMPANLERTQAFLLAAPDNPSALAMRGYVLAFHSQTASAQSDDSLISEAHALLDQALALQPDLVAPRVGRSWLLDPSDFLQQGELLEGSSVIGADSLMLRSRLRRLYRDVGRIQEAIDTARQASAASPYHCAPIFQEGWVVGAYENLALGVESIQRAIEICPQRDLFSDAYVDFLQMMYGDPETFRSMLENWDSAFQDWASRKPCYRTFLEARLSETPDAQAVRAICNEVGTNSDYMIRMATILGDIDLAYSLEPLLEQELNRPTVHFFYPEMSAFRADPRFMPLAASRGLTDYWLESGHWPDFCSEQRDLPYDCREEAQKAMQALE